MKGQLKRIFKIFSSNGLITFTSTILGVFIGIYVTDFYNRQSQLKARNDAFEQVEKEISNNTRLLIDYRDTLKVSFDRLKYFNSKLSDEFQIIIHKDSLPNFKRRLTSVLVVEKTMPIGNDSLRVSGDFNLNIKSNLVVFDLQTVIWNTFKQTNYLSLTPFTCISNIEKIYNLFLDFNSTNIVLRNNLLDGNYMKDKNAIRRFERDFRKILFKHDLLIKMCESSKDLMQNCDD